MLRTLEKRLGNSSQRCADILARSLVKKDGLGSKGTAHHAVKGLRRAWFGSVLEDTVR